MSDLISRQAAIEALYDWELSYTWDEHCKEEYDSPYIISPSKVIDGLPSAQPEQRWIPCSERLPEVYKDVLICWDFKGNREVLIGNMYSDGTFHGYDDEYLTHNGRKYRKAVAWMPLPEPYREERTEE